jgi:DNA-binding response OmpR family regulator
VALKGEYMMDMNTPDNRPALRDSYYQRELNPSSQSKKILIIDDDRDLRLALADILVNEGFKVVTAKNGEEALNYIATQSRLPSLVLLDLSMPVCNGEQFLKEHRQMKLDAEIPIVVVSGFLNREPFSASDNVKAYLEKPLNILELLNTIEMVCR